MLSMSLNFTLTMIMFFQYCSISAEVVFDSDLIKWADGKTLGISAKKIRSMVRLYKGLRSIQYGKKDPVTSDMIGSIIIDNINYSVHDLAVIENKLVNKGCHEDVNCDCPVKMSQLKTALAQAKKQVNIVHAPSIAESRGTKSMTVRFIKEWCQKAKRSDSYLLLWASIPEGQEEESFNSQINDFRTLDTFLSDLCGFLKDFIANCPKACKQAGIALPG